MQTHREISSSFLGYFIRKSLIFDYLNSGSEFSFHLKYNLCSRTMLVQIMNDFHVKTSSVFHRPSPTWPYFHTFVLKSKKKSFRVKFSFRVKLLSLVHYSVSVKISSKRYHKISTTLGNALVVFCDSRPHYSWSLMPSKQNVRDFHTDGERCFGKNGEMDKLYSRNHRIDVPYISIVAPLD